jgi:universal stress protein A
MSLYQNILVTIDMESSGDHVMEKITPLLADGGCIHLAHVLALTYIYSISPYISPAMDKPGIHQELKAQADTKLGDLAKKYKIPKENIHILIGSVPSEIHKLAKQCQSDLVAVGNHEKHGLDRLIGSTANKIIHGSLSDTLIVKIPYKTMNYNDEKLSEDL